MKVPPSIAEVHDPQEGQAVHEPEVEIVVQPFRRHKQRLVAEVAVHALTEGLVYAEPIQGEVDELLR